jgi:hypothetical protein
MQREKESKKEFRMLIRVELAKQGRRKGTDYGN